MDLICRLCLKLINDQMCELSDDSDILRKLRLSLSYNIKINKQLPKQFCKDCVNKIKEIYEFWTAIKGNERILEQHLQNNTLIEYYATLNNSYIKNENDIKTIYLHNEEGFNLNGHILRVEETNKNEEIKADLKHESNVESKRDTIINVKTENEFKEEDEVNYSSEDEDNVTLSLLQEEKYNRNPENRDEASNNLINVLQNYNCLTCDKVFDSHNMLKDHYKEQHTNTLSENIDTKYSEKVVNGKVMYKCEKCDKVYLKKYIKSHVTNHMNERPYVCKLCGRTYKTVSDIMRHGYRAHSNHKLYCSYKCGFSTAYSGALKSHENKIHKNEYKYTCEKCNKGFSVKTWYEQHQNVHTGLKPFVCDICGAAFHMDKYLRSHRSSLHPQSTSKKLLVCPHCDLKCDSVNFLALHLEKEHGVARNKNGKKKQCLCHFCGKILNRPEQLVFHRRMHLGEKPYNCRWCSKSFSRSFSLRVHERAHVPARLACACGSTYSQPSALYRHQRIHHGLLRKDTREEKSRAAEA